MAQTTWKLTGTYFETCNCDVACPCVFLSAPTEGECTVLIGWHIDNGHFDGENLDGFNVAFAVRSPGHMAKVKWDAAVYLDDKANEAQRDALLNIFSGQAGGHPAVLASHVGNILGVKSASIEYQVHGKRRSLNIDNFAAAEIEAIDGQGGAEVTVTNHPLCIAPSYPAVASKSKLLTFNDHGLSWNISEKNGFYSPFSYEAS
jgi:hypothetical protein